MTDFYWACRSFFIKLFHWEYWPFGILQLPLFFMWIYYAAREKSWFYFTTSNPSIPTGGMMGESKFEVMNLVPKDKKPATLLIKKNALWSEVESLLNQHSLNFPLIFKPDLGERGWRVERINNVDHAKRYIAQSPTDIVVQELVPGPLEFGVFYVRLPNENSGRVVSITSKEFLHVIGNGKDSLHKLIQQNPRAILQRKSLRETWQKEWSTIIPAGHKIELVSIGNHCLGTQFQNGNSLITPQLNEAFNEIALRIEGFYFGRFDLRCATLEDLQCGRVKILELNGCGAEPSHIYQPGSSVWQALKTLVKHWQTLYRVSRENHRRGVPYMSWREGVRYYKTFKALRSGTA